MRPEREGDVSDESPGMGEIDRRDTARVVSRDDSECPKIESRDFEESTTGAEKPEKTMKDQDQGGNALQVS
jgi:hypothetical protein